MTKMIVFHSFCRGVGRTTIIANIVALLAIEGRRIGVIDTNFQSPDLHTLFGLDKNNITHTLNDYLFGTCDITQIVYNITSQLEMHSKGEVFLIPASSQLNSIMRALQKNRNFIEVFHDEFQQMSDRLNLDVLIIDPQVGLNEETLCSMAIADVLLLLMRPDQQDYHGTAIMIDVVHKLNIPHMMLIVNKVPAVFEPGQVKAQVEKTYNCKVAAVLPHSDEMVSLNTNDIFVLRYPQHPMTTTLKQVVAELMIVD